MKTYFAFCDPSGGSSESMAMAIAHREPSGKAVCDGFWEKRPPFSPDECVREFSNILKRYRIRKVNGDRYAGEWVPERFRDQGIDYVRSEWTKSEIYAEFAALLNSGGVKLPENQRLRSQLRSLERRVSRSGKEIVEHLPGGHDDLANSVAGVLVLVSSVSRKRRELHVLVLEVGRNAPPPKSWKDPMPTDPNDPGPERWWHSQ